MFQITPKHLNSHRTEPACTRRNRMDVVEHLRALVGFDTQNPPRSFGAEILEYIKAELAGSEFEAWDHGEGRRTLLATRGAPEILIDFHLDTVPQAARYTRDPHVLHVEDGR